MSAGATGARNNVYPLTLSELETFGWLDGETVPLVMSVLDPEGRRYIPTKQRSSTGEDVYGSIVTREPPPSVPARVWEAEFGSLEHPRIGLRN